MSQGPLFQDALLDPNRGNGARRSRSLLAALATQAFVCGALLTLPLLHPAALPTVLARAEIKPPLPHINVVLQPVERMPRPVVSATASSLRVAQPANPVPEIEAARRGGMLTHAAVLAIVPGDPAITLGNGMARPFSFGSGPGDPGGTGSATSAVHVVPATASPRKPLTISSGVSAGHLLEPIRPHYPAVAIQMRQGGTVVVTATIDVHGRIADLRVLSGPSLLRNAALDAIRDARYQPFLLNGEPTEVVTTISVNFRLGGQS